jgi:ATP-binding protein involved in chromosome partitioning
MSSVAAVEAALANLKDPETGRSLQQTGQLTRVQAEKNWIEVSIGLTSWTAPLQEDFRGKVAALLQERFPGAAVTVSIEPLDRKPLPLGATGLLCRSVIAVGAGKGGVGKSTVAACLALALHRAGCRVGLLDADVYGPSIPQLLGVGGHPYETDGRIQPIRFQGMPVISMGFLVPPNRAVIWRGPMLHMTVTKFFKETDWGELDFLIVDMPPGTGDVALTLSQTAPIAGAVIVCTPQPVALLDATKAVAMFRQVNIPVVGVVENMSTFICPDNGKRYDIFGNGGARQYAEEAGIPFLGEVPINIQLRQRGDDGQTVANFDDPAVAGYLTELAEALVRQLAVQAENSPQKASLPVLG